MSRDMLLGVSPSDDGRSENGIGWGEARGNGQR